MATEVCLHDDFVLEPLSFDDIKWTAVSTEDQNGYSPLENDVNGKQIKYMSTALKMFSSKRKREPSVTTPPLGSSPSGRSVHQWRQALMKARSSSDPWDKYHIENCMALSL